jgi:hypothetical protein
MVSSGYGEMIRLVTPYAVKSKEFTAAIPSSGDAMPIVEAGDISFTILRRFEELPPL